MARRPSKHLRPARPLSASLARAQTKADGRWIVQTISADRALKPYLCPGCNHTIPVGLGHVVVWPDQPSIGSASAVGERRHWHVPCWARRR
ncbi:hypothetical protein [Nigerium sp.]|uniref:hypothetical protein n=1 Tax=Nigerium sp. TaxID=2042655 RepID=UPI0032213ACF